jgi:hypothetical protein
MYLNNKVKNNFVFLNFKKNQKHTVVSTCELTREGKL